MKAFFQLSCFCAVAGSSLARGPKEVSTPLHSPSDTLEPYDEKLFRKLNEDCSNVKKAFIALGGITVSSDDQCCEGIPSLGCTDITYRSTVTSKLFKSASNNNNQYGPRAIGNEDCGRIFLKCNLDFPLATSQGTAKVNSQVFNFDCNSKNCTLSATIKKVTRIDWKNRGLRGLFPESISYLSELQVMDFEGNRLSGAIPRSLLKLSKLRALNLASNLLNDGLLKQFANMPNLEFLRVENNSFYHIKRGKPVPKKQKRAPRNGKKPSPIMVVLPNDNLTFVPHLLAAKNPAFTLSAEDWEKHIFDPALKAANSSSSNGKLSKRQASAPKTLSPEELYALCPLNQVTSNIASGCIAGVYMKYCYQIPPTEAAFAQCHSVYNQVFSQSIFKTLGDICPAWKKGPRSVECAMAINNFYVDLGYMIVTPQMAKNLVNTIFSSKTYAPCVSVGTIVCRWI